jgi:hypothetical protein
MTARIVRAYLMGLRPITLDVISEDNEFLVGYELNQHGVCVSDEPRRLLVRAIRRLEEVA